MVLLIPRLFLADTLTVRASFASRSPSSTLELGKFAGLFLWLFYKKICNQELIFKGLKV